MSDWIRWVLTVLGIAAIVTASYLVAVETKPECPSYSEARYSQSGWYCTVPPLPK